MSECAVPHKTQRIHLQRPTTQTKHTPQGTIALPKSQSTANRSLPTQQVKGKGLKGLKQADAPYAPAANPTRTRPRHRQTNPNNLERFFPTSSKQLVVNSMPWRPSTHWRFNVRYRSNMRFYLRGMEHWVKSSIPCWQVHPNCHWRDNLLNFIGTSHFGASFLVNP